MILVNHSRKSILSMTVEQHPNTSIWNERYKIRVLLISSHGFHEFVDLQRWFYKVADFLNPKYVERNVFLSQIYGYHC